MRDKSPRVDDGYVRAPRPWTKIIHVLPFQDHAGNPALSTWENEPDRPLPFLYSYCIYFTHPDVRPDAPGSAEAARGLFETIIIDNTCWDPDERQIRLDMYFLPNGTSDDCMRHYRAERDARGVYTAQAEAAVSGAAQPETARMPGLVPSYAGSDCYHSLAYICDAPDWRGGEDETMTCLQFDPLTGEDAEPHGPGMIPETFSVIEAIARNSPGFGKPTGPFTTVWYMGEGITAHAPIQHMGEDEWSVAWEKGWTHW